MHKLRLRIVSTHSATDHSTRPKATGHFGDCQVRHPRGSPTSRFSRSVCARPSTTQPECSGSRFWSPSCSGSTCERRACPHGGWTAASAVRKCEARTRRSCGLHTGNVMRCGRLTLVVCIFVITGDQLVLYVLTAQWRLIRRLLFDLVQTWKYGRLLLLCHFLLFLLVLGLVLVPFAFLHQCGGEGVVLAAEGLLRTSGRLLFLGC